jgi:hypothetical protein
MLETFAVIPADVCVLKADVEALLYAQLQHLLIAVIYIVHSVQHVIILQQVAITAQLCVTNVQAHGLPAATVATLTAAVALDMYTLKVAIHHVLAKLKFTFLLLLACIVHKVVTYRILTMQTQNILNGQEWVTTINNMQLTT